MNITLKDIGEFVGGIITVILFLILMWLYLILTPDQNSAECDALRQEMEQMGVIGNGNSTEVK